jgi:hypothetical protein
MHEGKLAFLVAVDKEVDNCCLQTPEIDTESRLSFLETKIQSLEDELIAHNEIFCSKNENREEGVLMRRLLSKFAPATQERLNLKFKEMQTLGERFSTFRGR